MFSYRTGVEKMTIKDGYKVKVDYTGTLDDGTVFDSSEKHGEPLEFQIGTHMVIPGFEDAIKEMEVGAEKEIDLKPEEAYGDINPQMKQEVPKDQIPPEAKAGMMLLMTLPTGQQMPVKIAEIGEKTAKLDMNHPLAGKTLHFKLKLVDVQEGKLDSAAQDGCGCGHNHDKCGGC